MRGDLRFSKTFTEVQSNSMVDGTWKVTRVSTTPIDEEINNWVVTTGSIIVSVFTSVEHSSVQGDQYLTKLRYVITYTVAPAENSNLTLEQKSPGITSVIKPGGPTREDIAAAVQQVAKTKRHVAESIDVVPAEAPQATVAAPQPTVAVPKFEELDSPEEAELWQESELKTQKTARKEAELLAGELQKAMVSGNVPTRRKLKNKPTQRVVADPTPPISIPLEAQTQASTPTVDSTKNTEEGIPTRRQRRRPTS